MEKINILGTEYKLARYPRENYRFQDGIQGRCDSYLKEISVCESWDIPHSEGKPTEWFYLNESEVLHHEIVHAYLNECGLKYNTYSSVAWSQNEEMVDWIATQVDKIFASFKEADEWLAKEYLSRGVFVEN